jgi:hypothetical protein
MNRKRVAPGALRELAPQLHLRVGRLVVDAGVIGPGSHGLRGFEAALGQALKQQFSVAPIEVANLRPRETSLTDRLALVTAKHLNAKLSTMLAGKLHPGERA